MTFPNGLGLGLMLEIKMKWLGKNIINPVHAGSRVTDMPQGWTERDIVSRAIRIFKEVKCRNWKVISNMTS